MTPKYKNFEFLVPPTNAKKTLRTPSAINGGQKLLQKNKTLHDNLRIYYKITSENAER